VVHLLSLRRARRPDAAALAATLEPPSASFVFLALQFARDVGISQTISLFILAERVPSPA
jgi:hypothetical protein